MCTEIARLRLRDIAELGAPTYAPGEDGKRITKKAYVYFFFFELEYVVKYIVRDCTMR